MKQKNNLLVYINIFSFVIALGLIFFIYLNMSGGGTAILPELFVQTPATTQAKEAIFTLSADKTTNIAANDVINVTVKLSSSGEKFEVATAGVMWTNADFDLLPNQTTASSVIDADMSVVPDTTTVAGKEMRIFSYISEGPNYPQSAGIQTFVTFKLKALRAITAAAPSAIAIYEAGNSMPTVMYCATNSSNPCAGQRGAINQSKADISLRQVSLGGSQATAMATATVRPSTLAQATATAAPATTCTEGQTKCGTVCKNLKTDSNNCGTCGTICGSGKACQNGSCVSTTTTTPPPSNNNTGGTVTTSTTNICEANFTLNAVGYQCVDLKVLNSSGQVVSGNQVQPGQQVTLVMTGSVSNTTLPVTNGRFTINGQVVTATKSTTNPNEYRATYTIPNNITSINVKAEVQNPVGNDWKDSGACNAVLGPQMSYACADLEVVPAVAGKPIKPGDSVTLRVSGTTNSSAFDKGEFIIAGQTVNGVAKGNNVFEATYTAPSNATSIQARVHHPVSNQWYNGSDCQAAINPQYFECLDLTPSSLANIKRGDTLPAFTCEATGNGGSYAQFKLLSGATELTTSSNISLVSNKATWNAGYKIPENAPSGSYSVQCRVCDSNATCTNWGKAK